ncbi:energy transducer TonB [Aliikangiella marina]|uniref:Protein TonB n=1 Tax=Aliikangiella marina TaxID=1712262 RepID=A0A545T142_9GAMM|nr:energy transducer TonB [Aliikangiella marina]TQV70921.1 energy transducer TonB [Aliikangiella marina]
MTKYFFSLCLLSLCACASYEKVAYQEPPDAEKLGGVILEPVLKVRPYYPQKAKENGLNGWVMFEFNVGEIGEPVNIKVVDSHPKGLFIPEAKSAFKKWRFQSIKKDTVKKQFSIVYFE